MPEYKSPRLSFAQVVWIYSGLVMETGIGQTIRNARVRRGVSIEQLSHVTKISSTILRALEAEELDRIPGGVFTRGFIRSCARELGLDPESVVAAFVAQHGRVAGAVAGNEPDAIGHAAVIHADVEANDGPLLSESSSNLAQMIVIAIIVAAVGYLSVHNRSDSALAASAPAPVVREIPVGTSGTIDAREAVPVRTTPELTLKIEAIGPCWVAAASDGTPAVARLLDAGDSQTIAAHDEIRLRVGDPASVSFTLNGVAGRSLGDSGQAVSVRITSQNLREFQAK
ncbi:MAG TPA: helix-turn-helix domain-containing protein [Vicinamibacterales bacterium]|nr:helix-turn-helix domain-containing protein [Vicinamibacterales bacterium]